MKIDEYTLEDWEDLESSAKKMLENAKNMLKHAAIDKKLWEMALETIITIKPHRDKEGA